MHHRVFQSVLLPANASFLLSFPAKQTERANKKTTGVETRIHSLLAWMGGEGGMFFGTAPLQRMESVSLSRARECARGDMWKWTAMESPGVLEVLGKEVKEYALKMPQ